jgi:hypothetical protein
VRSREELAGPVWDLEEMAKLIGVKPRSVHQAIARGRMQRPRQRTHRGALAWTETEALEVVRDHLLDALPAGLWRRLDQPARLVMLEHARRIAVIVLRESRGTLVAPPSPASAGRAAGPGPPVGEGGAPGSSP